MSSNCTGSTRTQPAHEWNNVSLLHKSAHVSTHASVYILIYFGPLQDFEFKVTINKKINVNIFPQLVLCTPAGEGLGSGMRLANPKLWLSLIPAENTPLASIYLSQKLGIARCALTLTPPWPSSLNPLRPWTLFICSHCSFMFYFSTSNV